MAGSINLSLSQQFDITNGQLLSGGKLYFFAAGTTTPQLVYQDQALTIAHPNPITLGSDGRIPLFYVADGSIRARLVNKAGITQFDSDNILVVGPSSGGGGGASVDPTTIFATGDVIWLDVSGTRSGWVRDNGRTIGSATSGASERANSDCQTLFEWLWNNKSDTLCPVSTGRGATSSADWAANKTITLPDKRGYMPAGLDDMGNSAASRFSGVTFSTGNATTAGSFGGEALHTLSSTEIPAHSHSITDPGHSHVETITNAGAGSSTAPAHDAGVSTVSNAGFSTAAATTGITLANAGGGGSHNNMPPFVVGTWYRKL